MIVPVIVVEIEKAATDLPIRERLLLFFGRRFY